MIIKLENQSLTTEAYRFCDIVLKAVPNIEGIILFGSFSKKSSHSWSDIDLAIIGAWQEKEKIKLLEIMYSLAIHNRCYRIHPTCITNSEFLNKNENDFISEVNKGILLFPTYKIQI